MPIRLGQGHSNSENHQVRFIEILGHRIAYRETGSGIPIVFVHGLASSSYTWTYLVEELPDDYRCILLDLKGFGDSDKPGGDEYRLVDQASILEEFLEQLGLDDVVLVGHSYGGAVILSYLLTEAGSQNDKIRAVILVDTPGYSQELPPLVSQLTTPLLSRVLIEIVPSRFLAKRTLRGVFFDSSKISKDLIGSYDRSIKSPGAKRALLKTARIISDHERPFPFDQLSAISIPTLIIWGEDDTIIPLANGVRFSADLPNANLRIVSQCGHAPQEECPIEMARYMKGFLEELSAPVYPIGFREVERLRQGSLTVLNP